MYVRSGSNETKKCTDYEYSGDIGHTIVSEVRAYLLATFPAITVKLLIEVTDFYMDKLPLPQRISYKLAIVTYKTK